MPVDYKKRPVLSDDMVDFKEKVHQQALDNRLALKQAHKVGTVLSSIVDGVSNFGTLVFQSSKNFPVVGFAMRMVGVGLSSVVIILDPKKPLKDKILPLVFLSIVTGLSIAAFVVGSIFAAAVGTAISAVMALVETVMIVAKSIEMRRLSKAYDKRKIFELLVDNRTTPEEGNDKLFEECNEVFAVRHAELKEILRRNTLPPKDRGKVQEEFDYIDKVVQAKNISLTQNAAKELNTLYIKRENKLSKMASIVGTLKEKSDKGEDTSQEIDKIEQLQGKIIAIDNTILETTASAKQLKLDKMKAKEEFFYSLGNLGLALAGLALSIAALLMITSVAGSSAVAIPASPILTAMAAVGMIATFVSFGKFVAEKIAEQQDTQQLLQKETGAKEELLEEALYKYQTQMQMQSQSQVPSYNAMKEILNSKPKEVALISEKNTPLSEESIQKLNLGKVQRPLPPLPESKPVTITTETVDPEPVDTFRP